jgi:hypothetical protein
MGLLHDRVFRAAHPQVRAKNRHGTTYEYLICLGRQQKRTDCRQQAIRVDQTEDAVADAYASIQLTPEQADQVRDYVLDEMNTVRASAGAERRREERRLSSCATNA